MNLRCLSPFVLAELDYLLATKVSREAELALLDQVAAGAYRLEPMAADDIARASEVVLQYRDLGLSLSDASIVVLAERHGTLDLLTLDERHFRAIAGPAVGRSGSCQRTTTDHPVRRSNRIGRCRRPRGSDPTGGCGGAPP
jgi:predicted nucleic acid-binding protein